MKNEEGKACEREKDEACIALLRQLKQKVLARNISTARVAAFNLSWMQEDGLAILTEVLTGNFSRTAKKAAAYGLRSMNGRMRKMAMEVLEQGLNHRDRTTKAACVKGLFLMKGGSAKKAVSDGNRRTGNTRIQGVRNKHRTRTGNRGIRGPNSR